MGADRRVQPLGHMAGLRRQRTADSHEKAFVSTYHTWSPSCDKLALPEGTHSWFFCLLNATDPLAQSSSAYHFFAPARLEWTPMGKMSQPAERAEELLRAYRLGDKRTRLQLSWRRTVVSDRYVLVATYPQAGPEGINMCAPARPSPQGGRHG